MNDWQRNTPRIAPSWPTELEHVTHAATDISQLHTHLLGRPTSVQGIAVDTPATNGAYQPLPQPILPDLTAPGWRAPAKADPRTTTIAAHLQVAIRLRKEAEGWLNTLQATASLATDASAHWLDLVHLVGRTAQQNQAYKRLEEQILDYSRRLANLRQRWSACMAQAREHEEIARVMQDTSLSRGG